MKVLFHLRCRNCNRLFAKLLIGREGEKILSFKCPRCSRARGKEIYCNHDLASLERFFETPEGQ
jgi:phage FluMu protein Com